MKRILLSIVALSLIAVSCSDDSTTGPDKKNYQVPSNYNFENVNFSGQTTRLAMIDEIIEKMEESRSGTVVSSKTIIAMLNNFGNLFSDPNLNASDKNIYSKLEPNSYSFFTDLLSEMDKTDPTATAENGKGGIVQSKDGVKKYFISAKGHDFGEMMEKGLMGALMLYQVNHYLSDEEIGIGVDNKTVVEGEGTAMQHHWDEAFGYFGAPKEFPLSVEGVKFVAKYCNSKNSITNYNKLIMDEGYLRGRAAINNNDTDTKWESVKCVKKYWELIFVTTAVHYLNGAKANFTDDALRTHQLSECWGFLWAIQFNSVTKGNYYQLALDKLGDNFWDISVNQIDEAIDILTEGYKLQSIKSEL